jgi:hypothetical protein
MIKKQQKWIALLVTCTFIWLLQVSTMPVAAAGAPEQISAANVEQAPDFIEEEDDGGYQAKKSSILPIILIGVGVAAAAAVLFLVVLKTKYDITGEWRLTRVGGFTYTRYLTFSGDKKTGTVRIDFDTWGSSEPDTGTYTVDGKAVSFNQYWASNHTYEYNYVGNFTDKDTMSGTFTMSMGGPDSGTWTATRRAAATIAPEPSSSNSQDQSPDAKRRR